jgi:hypothetical protein
MEKRGIFMRKFILIVALGLVMGLSVTVPAQASGSLSPPITFNTSRHNTAKVYAYTKPKCKGHKVTFGPGMRGAWGYASVRLHKRSKGTINWTGNKKDTKLTKGKCKSLVKPVVMIYAKRG